MLFFDDLLEAVARERSRFFMFYNIFLHKNLKKNEKMQKNAKKCKKIKKKFAYIKNLL